MTEHPERASLVMELASRPGEGRVRQLVATTIRVNAAALSTLRPWIDRWLTVEADEFALRAMRDTVQATQATPPSVSAGTAPQLPRHFSETYRYVSDRLCHVVRNALALPDTELKRLELEMGKIKDDAFRATLTQIHSGLYSGFLRVARAVEYDLTDGHMTWASIHLAEWLMRSTADYGQRFGSANMKVHGGTEAQARIWAVPFLLEVVFANLWLNAVQAAGAGCKLEVEITQVGRRLEVLMIDSGPGFDESALSVAFQAQYSTKGNGGRGLLEIAEAIERLQGNVRLVPTRDSFRIQLVLPLEGS